jgi:hypothetical protein
MGYFLLVGATFSRLLVFYLGRRYGKSFKFGWLGALTFGGITGMFVYVVFAHRASLGHPQDYYWLIPILVFVLSFLATLTLDRPHSRWVPLAIAWHIIIIAVLCFVFVVRVQRGY